MKTIIFFVTAMLFNMAAYTQISNATTTTIKISGNCGMCESAIEKAGTQKQQYKTDWDEHTKMATITYNAATSSLNTVLKQIALAGYDSPSFLAPTDAYEKLPACCKYTRDQKPAAADKAEGAGIAHPLTDSHASHAMKPAEAVLEKVYAAYFNLKDALVKSDATLASAAAKELETAIQGVKMDKLPATVHQLWMKLQGGLKEDAEHINENKDIAHQRDHFMNLSKLMYELIKQDKPQLPVYYQFCPMANNGKGANWLSKENAIKNPYYGNRMLTCGKTVETLQ